MQVNSENDDKGIVVGNWSGMYDDGTAPWMWTGSPAIMDEYFKNGGEQSVKYGQCWVFAGVATTGKNFGCFHIIVICEHSNVLFKGIYFFL